MLEGISRLRHYWPSASKILSNLCATPPASLTRLWPCFHFGGGVAAGPLLVEAPYGVARHADTFSRAHCFIVRVLRARLRRRRQSRHQGPLSPDRLSGGHRAARHHVDGQFEIAQLRAGARAARALGHRRAAGLDRDAARRRPADRGGDAGDRRQRVARPAARRAQGRQDRQPYADGRAPTAPPTTSRCRWR